MADPQTPSSIGNDVAAASWDPTDPGKKGSENVSIREKPSSRSDCSIDSGTNTGSSSNARKLEPIDTGFTTFEDQAHTGNLYRDGVLVRQPAPTQDPRDPLNLSRTRKVVAMFCLCFFGALAAAAELILGAMLPVFALQYAHINPKLLIEITANGGLPAGADPLKYLSELPNAPPIWKVYLLASLPVLMIGLCNLAFVPLAIAIGRRPVILGCGIVAIVGCNWAGFSQSLGSHLGARSVQALGAGTVESLIPFIIQDMCFVHERNSWMSVVFAIQGVLIIALGIAAPYMIIRLSWRWVYFITAIGAGFFLVGVFLFLPETRWPRSRSEMSKCFASSQAKHY
jgi:hypothetical protein